MLLSEQDLQRYCKEIDQQIDAAKTIDDLFSCIVNAPFKDVSKVVSLDLGIIVLLLVNKKTGMLDRVALADTEMAKGAVEMSTIPFEEIKIPVDYTDNILIQALQSVEPKTTDDWQYLFNPILTPKQAQFNQAGAGIECSVAYPLNIKDGGALIFSYFQPPRSITPLHDLFMKTYAESVALRLSKFLK